MLLNSSDILQQVICFSLLSLNDFYIRFWKKNAKDSSGLSVYLLFFSGSSMCALLQHGDIIVAIPVKFNP